MVGMAVRSTPITACNASTKAASRLVGTAVGSSGSGASTVIVARMRCSACSICPLRQS